MKQLGAILFALVISGCASMGSLWETSPQPSLQPVVPEPTTTDALIYIYRPTALANGAQDAYFYVDGINIADVSNGRYTWFYAPAGEHTLKQKWFGLFLVRGLELKTNWLPGQTYFYRFDLSTILIANYSQLSEIPAEQAKSEISCCRHQPAFDVKKLMQPVANK